MGSLTRAYQSPSLLRQMLADGGSPNSELDSQNGVRLIHRAAIENKTDVLKILLGHQVELEATTKEGLTAVDLALKERSLDSLKFLLEAGANPNGGPNKAESTLHTAAKIEGDERFMHYLLDHNASCDTTDQHGDMPIHRACHEENVRGTELLLAHRPHSCNQHGSKNQTPLHIAANLGNSKLFLTILRYGPRLDLLNSQDLTAIDIVLSKQDTSILEGMGHWMVNPVLTSGGSSIQQLLAMPQGQRFLRLLRKLDNDFQHNFGHIECEGEVDPVECHAVNPLLKHIQDNDQLDISEFVDIVLRACNEGQAHNILKIKGLVGKISDNFLKQIFVPQNETLLQEIMKLGVLWSAVVTHLENNILDVYYHSLGERRKDGIKGLVYRNCVEDDGKVSSSRLHKLVATMTGFRQLQWVDELDFDNGGNDDQMDEQLYAMRDPVQSLAVWSVLTGRLRLAPYFLRQEDFDMIPQALLLAKMLRSLGARRDIEDIYANKAVKMAITCEGIAMQALRRIKDVDVTPDNCLTMELVMLPLETFGGYSILELAAKGESSNFVIIDIVQEALNRLWYGDFFFARKDSRQSMLMELAIACGFVPFLFPVLLNLMPRIRVNEPDYVKLQSSASDLLALNNCRFEETHGDGPEVALLQSSGKKSKTKVSVSKELLSFYQIPCVKFRIHVVAHAFFVLLLSYVVMFKLGKDITVVEIICYLTLLGFLVEEINEMITSAKEETVKDYFLDGWNVIDLTAITCGFVAFALRMINTNPIQRYWSLVLLTTTCLVYWVRLLYVSVVLESLGPKLKMMSLMVKKDFLPFLFILFILMFGFGVTFHALQFPEGKSISSIESKESASDIILGMFRNTFYAIVGEYGLDTFEKVCNISDIEGANPQDGDDPNCVHPIGAVLVPTVYMVLYIVVMQILLLNVIVAMFSKTIDAIDSESKAMWQFEKFDLIDEFNTRSALPPPFNTLSEVRNVAKYIWRKLCNKRPPPDPKSQPLEAVKETPHDSKVYMLSLYYQSLAFRRSRSTFNGIVLDEEDLDEGNKIIFQQINAINEKLERFDGLDDTVKKLESLVKELKAINMKGPSNINPKRASVMNMPFIEEGQV